MTKELELIISSLELLELRIIDLEIKIDALAEEERNASKESFEKIKSFFERDLKELKRLI